MAEIAGVSAGGMPTRVKCLHVHLAQALAEGPGANPFGDETLARIGPWWTDGPCVVHVITARVSFTHRRSGSRYLIGRLELDLGDVDDLGAGRRGEGAGVGSGRVLGQLDRRLLAVGRGAAERGEHARLGHADREVLRRVLLAGLGRLLQAARGGAHGASGRRSSCRTVHLGAGDDGRGQDQAERQLRRDEARTRRRRRRTRRRPRPTVAALFGDFWQVITPFSVLAEEERVRGEDEPAVLADEGGVRRLLHQGDLLARPPSVTLYSAV